MKKIGILFGKENDFPYDLVNNINRRNSPGIKAEFISIGTVKMGELHGYNVILDRVSHEVPFYNSVLKAAVLEGVRVVNNPFRSNIDDYFLQNTIASQMKINSPRVVLLPSKEHPPRTSSDTFRNLKYPLNWDDVFQYIGFPANLKSNFDNSNNSAFKVNNREEFFAAYEMTESNVMTLQAYIEFEEYFYCYAIGKKNVNVIKYDPEMPENLRFKDSPKGIDDNLKRALTAMSVKVSSAFGLDFNAVEIAVSNGLPYMYKFINTFPPVEPYLLNNAHYDWTLEKMSDLLIEAARIRKSKPGINNWSRFLSGALSKN